MSYCVWVLTLHLQINIPPVALKFKHLTTVTFVKFSGRQILYGLSQMQLSHAPLQQVPGLQFYKIMGSGAGNGFSIRPDFSTFCLLAHWEDEASEAAFFKSNPFWQTYAYRGKVYLHARLQASKTHGSWGGINPFEKTLSTPSTGERIAVLTRATIKKRHLWSFWKEVPAASRPVNKLEGLIYSKGVGEWPLFMQATISIWENREAMVEYAYRNKAHVEMIRKTRQKGWYREEMFTEFELVSLNLT